MKEGYLACVVVCVILFIMLCGYCGYCMCGSDSSEGFLSWTSDLAQIVPGRRISINGHPSYYDVGTRMINTSDGYITAYNNEWYVPQMYRRDNYD